MELESLQVGLDKKGIINPYKNKLVRRLSDLSRLFSDNIAVTKMLDKNPILYEVYELPQPPENGLFSMATTVLYPGKVGREYFFTKGHFHAKEPTSEVYIGVEGEGLILLQSRECKVAHLPLRKNDVVVIQPGWAHRTVNTGKKKMVFLSIYPSDAGHDYEAIEKSGGFAKLVVEERGKPRLVDNEKYRKQ